MQGELRFHARSSLPPVAEPRQPCSEQAFPSPTPGTRTGSEELDDLSTRGQRIKPAQCLLATARARLVVISGASLPAWGGHCQGPPER